MRQPLFARFFRLVALMLAIQLCTTPILFAKTLTAEVVREKIQKRGRDSVVWLRENSGLILHGRVNNIAADSFQLQLWNDPELVDVRYADVVEMHQGLGTRGTVIFLVASIGAGAAITAYGIHSYESNKPPALTTPTLPGFPAVH